MSKNVADYQKWADELGLDVVSKSKSDYIAAIRDFLWERDHKGEIMLPQLEPMLANKLDVLMAKGKMKENPWTSDKWVNEKKLNGVRMYAIFWRYEDGKKVVRFTSRNPSEVTCLFNEALNIPHLSFDFPDEWEGMILDGEVYSLKHRVKIRDKWTKDQLNVVTGLLGLKTAEEAQSIMRDQDAWLKYVMYDIRRLPGGKDTAELKIPFGKRRDIIEEIIKHIPNEHYMLVEQARTPEAKRELYDRLIEAGDEGVMFKHLEGVYKPGPNRSNDLLKKKREVIDFDCFVIGCNQPNKDTAWDKEHLLGSVKFGAYDESNNSVITEVASVSGIDLEMRRRISIWNPDTNLVEIDSSMLGKVAAVTGFDWSPKSGTLQHPRISRWREGADGKDESQCTFNRTDVLSEYHSKRGE